MAYIQAASLVTQLVRSIGMNDVDEVKNLLAMGAQINAVARDGFTPLCISSFWGSTQIIKLLLEHGAEIDLSNYGTNWSPLHCAAFQGQGPAVMLLLKHGPNLELEDSNRCTPVDFASVNNKIWGFFENAGCTRTDKKTLIAKGIISKSTEPVEEAPHPDAQDDIRRVHFSRPGSAYVVNVLMPSLSRPATASSRQSSRPNSGDSDGGRDYSGYGTPGPLSKLSMNKMKSGAAYGDVLGGVPSPVSEESPSPVKRFGGF